MIPPRLKSLHEATLHCCNKKLKVEAFALTVSPVLQGQTAFDIALRDNNTDIMHLMIEHYYDVQQNLENEDILLQDQAPS